MPSLQSKEVERGNPGNVNTPTWLISAIVQQDGVVVADFTGTNALRFPAVLATLSIADQDDLIQTISNEIIYRAAAQQGGG